MFETKNLFQGSSKKKGKQKLDVSKLEKKVKNNYNNHIIIIMAHWQRKTTATTTMNEWQINI